MTMGWIIRNYQYSLKQISAVVVVTAGIVIFTLASYEPGAQNVSYSKFFNLEMQI